MGCFFLIPFTKTSRPEPGRCHQDEIMLVGPRFSALFLSVLAQGMRQDGGYQLPTLGKKSFFSSIKKSQA